MATAVTTNDLALLHEKIDFLTEQMEAQRRRQIELDELKNDLIPIVNHMVSLSIEELAEIGTEFQLEDLLFLLKRVLRNTEAFLRLMDMLEASMGLSDEINLLGAQVFSNLVETADRLEREGYFAFIREGWGIFERIVAEFDEQDVRALGDNIVTILTTVRNMTQPEVLALANNAVTAIHPTDQAEDISTLQLLRSLSDPQVRRGMARLLNIVKTLASDPADPNVN
ncbi:MAG: DUF1641 domain-containing protein [Anaerolineales bacterium]|nr:DUF1641 domain-containing protein [Anaerolineales bacterium]